MTSKWKFNILQVRPYFVMLFSGTLKKIQFQYYNTLVTTEYKESLKIELKGSKLHCTMSVLGLKNEDNEDSGTSIFSVKKILPR